MAGVILGYGLLAYLVFFGTILYAIHFVTGIPGVDFRRIDGPPVDASYTGWAINVLLLCAFALQHNVMARRFFKVRWTKIVPAAAERSTFTLISSLLLILLFWQWRAMPDSVWSIQNDVVRVVLTAISFLGWALVFYATFLIDHFELFGLSQVWRNFKKSAPAPKRFVTPSMYKVSRHPLYLGFIVAFWAAPDMSVGRLAFALITTIFILWTVILFEERDLIRDFGDEYRSYQRRVAMLFPFPKRGGGSERGSGESPEASS